MEGKTLKLKNLALCGRQECVLKDKCVRAQGLQMLTESDVTFVCVNPALVTGNEDCPMAKIAKPVRMAYGFMGLLGRLPKNVSDGLRDGLFDHFSKNPYYDRRNGHRAMPPEEQNYIIKLVQQLGGVVEEEPFDRYEVEEVL